MLKLYPQAHHRGRATLVSKQSTNLADALGAPLYGSVADIHTSRFANFPGESLGFPLIMTLEHLAGRLSGSLVGSSPSWRLSLRSCYLKSPNPIRLPKSMRSRMTRRGNDCLTTGTDKGDLKRQRLNISIDYNVYVSCVYLDVLRGQQACDLRNTPFTVHPVSHDSRRWVVPLSGSRLEIGYI